jgi:hypothetical protein
MPAFGPGVRFHTFNARPRRSQQQQQQQQQQHQYAEASFNLTQAWPFRDVHTLAESFPSRRTFYLIRHIRRLAVLIRCSGPGLPLALSLLFQHRPSQYIRVLRQCALNQQYLNASSQPPFYARRPHSMLSLASHRQPIRPHWAHPTQQTQPHPPDRTRLTPLPHISTPAPHVPPRMAAAANPAAFPLHLRQLRLRQARPPPARPPTHPPPPDAPVALCGPFAPCVPMGSGRRVVSGGHRRRQADAGRHSVEVASEPRSLEDQS